MKVGGQVGNFNLGLMQVRTAAEGAAPGEDLLRLPSEAPVLQPVVRGNHLHTAFDPESTIPDRHSVGVDFQLATSRFRGNRNLRGIVNTQFSPFMSLPNNIQYDSVSRLLGWQLQ